MCRSRGGLGLGPHREPVRFVLHANEERTYRFVGPPKKTRLMVEQPYLKIATTVNKRNCGKCITTGKSRKIKSISHDSGMK